jgi:hypothetical protein
MRRASLGGGLGWPCWQLLWGEGGRGIRGPMVRARGVPPDVAHTLPRLCHPPCVSSCDVTGTDVGDVTIGALPGAGAWHGVSLEGASG